MLRRFNTNSVFQIGEEEDYLPEFDFDEAAFDELPDFLVESSEVAAFETEAALTATEFGLGVGEAFADLGAVEFLGPIGAALILTGVGTRLWRGMERLAESRTEVKMPAPTVRIPEGRSVDLTVPWVEPAHPAWFLRNTRRSRRRSARRR